MTGTLEPLPRALALFECFEEAGIPYCHYKSNEHLLEGLAGVTDLDLLLSRRRARDAQAALQRAGYKRFASRFAAAYPAVEDYLGFDAGSGRLIHAHVYYALVVGQKHLKGYQLGFDDAVLATRVADPQTGVYTSDPSYEMLLLLVRYALKAGWRDAAREALGRRFFDADACREHLWLRARLQPGILNQIAEEQLGKAAGARVERLCDGPPSIWELLAFRRQAGAALGRFRTFGPLEGVPLKLVREVAALLGGLNRRLLRLPVPLRRTHPAGGRIIAFLGPDGSGKSTVLAEIGAWLGWKLDVYPVYLGSGDGPASLLRWPLKRAVQLVRGLGARRETDRAGTADPEGEPEPLRPRRLSVYRALWALLLAFEKRSKIRAAVKARNRGMIVVCDRYPQIQTMGFNDGPLLSEWLESASGLRRRLARWEFETYQKLTLSAPDLVVKLDVTPEVAYRRKAETPRGEVERRRVAVQKVDYGPGSEILEVDATLPLDEVLLQVKHAIWAQL
jgi:thymidylate kinase